MTPNLSLPVRLLASSRKALGTHLVSLGPEDRRLRFGAPIADELVLEYVHRIHFGRDEVFAVTGHDLALLGVVHVAFTGKSAELGVSVLPVARGGGVGNALFERAVMHLRSRGVRSVFMHCLAENGAIMHLAHKHGMRIVHAGGESEAHLELAAPTPETYVNEWMRDQQANTLEALKRNADFARRFVTFFAPG